MHDSQYAVNINGALIYLYKLYNILLDQQRTENLHPLGNTCDSEHRMWCISCSFASFKWFCKGWFRNCSSELWCGRGGGVRGSVTLPNCRYSGSVLAVCPRHCSQLSKYH